MFSNVLNSAVLEKCNIHSTFSDACNAHISPQVSTEAPPNSTVFKSGSESGHSWNRSALLAYVCLAALIETKFIASALVVPLNAQAASHVFLTVLKNVPTCAEQANVHLHAHVVFG